MERDDFFVEVPYTSPWGQGDPWATAEQFNRDLVDAARRGPVEGYDEVGLAIGLVDLLHDELRRYGTDSSQKLDDKQISLVRLAVEATLRRLGINLTLPFRDFERFRSYWIKKGASGGGGWQARRDILTDMLDPLTDNLVKMEERSLDELARTGLAPWGNGMASGRCRDHGTSPQVPVRFDTSGLSRDWDSLRRRGRGFEPNGI